MKKILYLLPLVFLLVVIGFAYAEEQTKITVASIITYDPNEQHPPTFKFEKNSGLNYKNIGNHQELLFPIKEAIKNKFKDCDLTTDSEVNISNKGNFNYVSMVGMRLTRYRPLGGGIYPSSVVVQFDTNIKIYDVKNNRFVYDKTFIDQKTRTGYGSYEKYLSLCLEDLGEAIADHINRIELLGLIN